MTFRSSARRRLAVVVIGVLTALSLVGTAAADPAAASDRRGHHGKHSQHHGKHRKALPPIRVWHRDVARAISGTQGYLKQRAAAGGRLAVVLGIDNVALATHYDWPHAVPPTRRLARRANALGYAVFFVTGRTQRDARRLARPLRAAGFEFDGICGRAKGLRIAAGKLRCRRNLTRRGYTITANVSTHRQAYAGGYYERAVMLPSYGGRLS